MKKNCPQEEIIADYLENRLSNEERRQLELSLAENDECLEEILVAKNLIHNNGLQEYVPVSKRVTNAAIHLLENKISAPHRSVKDTIFRPLKHLWSRIANFDSFTVYSNTEPAHVRSYELSIHAGNFRTKKSFENIEVEIDIEKKSPHRAVIRVYLVSDTQKEYNIRVTLSNNDSREISSFLLANGFAVFEDLPFGHYNLIFIRKGVAIGTYPFEIKGDDHGE
jgi:hypothetical protein